MEATLSALREELQSAKLTFSTSMATLNSEKTTLEKQVETHKKELKLVQAEFDAEKVRGAFLVQIPPTLLITSFRINTVSHF